MKQKLFLPVILLLCIFSACHESTNHQHSIDNIILKVDNGDVITGLPADSVFNSVQYIPLETTEESFLGEIDKVKIQDSLILAYNKNLSSIFIFDMSGKYLNKLQKRGRGNGEYLLIDDFNIANDTLVVLDDQRQQLLYYSLGGMNFLKKVNLDGFYSHFELLNDQVILYANFSGPKEKYYNLVAIDNKKQHSVRPMLPFPDTQKGTSYGTNYIFYRHNNAAYTSIPWDYSIYKIDSIDIQKVLTFDFQDYSVPISVRGASTQEQKKYMSKFDFVTRPINEIRNLIVTDKYYIFSFIHRCMTYTCRYKIEDKTHIHGVIGGTKRFPYYDQTYHGAYKNKLISWVSAPRIVDCRMTKKNIIKRPDILIDIHEMSNPVITLYDIK